MVKYKVVEDFTVPGHKAYKKGEECQLIEETGNMLVSRGLLTPLEAKKEPVSVKDEEKVEDTKEEEKSTKKAKDK